MNAALLRLISRILMVCLFAMPLRLQAGPIGTDVVASPAQARDSVKAALQRAEVAAQLQAFGLSEQAAQQRVDALNDSEVVRLAGQIDKVPAGAALGFLIIALILIWRFYADPALAEKEKPAAKKAAPTKEAPKK